MLARRARCSGLQYAFPKRMLLTLTPSFIPQVIAGQWGSPVGTTKYLTYTRRESGHIRWLSRNLLILGYIPGYEEVTEEPVMRKQSLYDEVESLLPAGLCQVQAELLEALQVSWSVVSLTLADHITVITQMHTL